MPDDQANSNIDSLLTSIANFSTCVTPQDYENHLPFIHSLLLELPQNPPIPIQQPLTKLARTLLNPTLLTPIHPHDHQLTKNTLLTLIRKVVAIYATHTRKAQTLQVIKEALTTKCTLLVVEKTGWMTSHATKEYTEFHKECTSETIEQLLRYPKIIWDLHIRDITSLIKFLNGLAVTKVLPQLFSSLIDIYFTQIHAFFTSGRPILTDFAHRQLLQLLFSALSVHITSQENVRKVYFLGPTLALTLIRSRETIQVVSGVKLLDSYLYEATGVFSNNKPLTTKTLQKFIEDNDIYQAILTFDGSDELMQHAESITRSFRNSPKTKKKIASVISILQSGRNISKRVIKILFTVLDCYFLIEFEQKEMIFNHVTSLKDYTNMYFEYFECICDMCHRNDFFESKNRADKMLQLIFTMIRGSYMAWNDAYKRKSRETLKRIIEKVVWWIKTLKADEKISYVKGVIAQLCDEISNLNMVIFNSVFIQGELGKVFSNNPFQKLMTQYAQKNNLFDRIFDFLKKTPEEQVLQKEFIRSIKFITSKMNTKLQFTQDYLDVITKFPDVYEEMLNSTGYAHCQSQIRMILQLLKTKPNTPFHIFKVTFRKLHYQQFSDHARIPSLIDSTIQEPTLKMSPDQMNYIEELMGVLNETTSDTLRREISQYLVLLYISHMESKYFHGDETFLSFLGQLEENFLKDGAQFLKQGSTLPKTTMLATLQLILQAMQVTDVTGPGEYRPHNCLISTSTTPLTVLNNITFGDDVEKVFHRNLPSSMTLFDALTQIGLAFKCGPEEILLKKNGKMIPMIYNARAIEELQLHQGEIIAQKNQGNRLQTPPIQSEKGVLTETFKQLITDIFKRFSFDGKMSLIECTNYIRQTTGSEILSSDRRVTDIIDFYDSDHDGIVVLDDFIRYYKDNLTKYSTYYKENILKGLFNLRYRKNLTLYDQPLDISSSYFKMMRFILRSHACCYPLLFQLARNKDKEVATKTQEILLYLPSQPENKSHLKGKLDFSENTQFETYYQLITVVQSLTTAQDKKAAIINFTASQNDQIIFKLLNQLQGMERNDTENRMFLLCLKILRALVSIQNLTTLDISTFSFEPQSIPVLPATSLFSEAAIQAYHRRDIINFETLLVLQLTQDKVDFASILEGCFHDEEEIRRISCGFIYAWGCKTKWAQDLFSVKIPQNNCEEWFNVLCAVIKTNPSLNLIELRDNIFEVILKKKETVETSFDKLLYGYLKMLLSLVGRLGPDADQSKLEECLLGLLERTLSSTNRQIIYETLTIISPKAMLSYFKSMLEDISPSAECQLRQEYLGIRNLGAICYINSIIQQFFMIDSFRQLILTQTIPVDCKEAEVDGKVVIDDFMWQLQRMFHHLELSHKKYIVPKQFCYSYKDWDGQPINTAIQEDSHEFLNRLIEKVEHSTKQEERLPELENILSAKTLTEIECNQCKHIISKEESNYCFMVEVKDRQSLADSLKKFNEKEEIQGYYCEKCDKKVNKIGKRTYLKELPEVVVLNLQRILYDPTKGQKVKVHTKMTFPHQLSFADYMKIPQPNSDYRLKGVVIHTGTSEGGHYYSIIRRGDGQWFKFNDHNVVPFDPKEIPRECFGGVERDDDWGTVTYSTNAYILFYERVNTPALDHVILDNPFAHQIKEENTKLVRQIQIHQECFFRSVCQLSDHAPDLDGLLSVAQKSFTFLGIFRKAKAEYRTKLGSIIEESFLKQPQLSMAFFHELDAKQFLNNVTSHQDQSYRLALKNIFLKAFTVARGQFQINFENETPQSSRLSTILELFIQQLPSRHFYSNLSKTGAFVDLLEGVMTESAAVAKLFLSKDMLFRLLELVIGRDSSYMKYHPYVQDLPNHIATTTLNMIARFIPYRLNLTGHSRVESMEIAPSNTTSLEGSVLANPKLWQKIGKNKYESKSLAEITMHYSYKDLQFSAMTAELMLTQLGQKETLFEDESQQLVRNVQNFLSLEDDYQEQRLGWILGVAQNKGMANDYCLEYSHRSDYITFVSTLLSKNDTKKPLLHIIYDDKARDNILLFEGIRLVLQLAQNSQTVFNFLAKTPPTTYLTSHYCEWIEQWIKTRSQESEKTLLSKVQILTTISSLYDHFIKRLETSGLKLPVRNQIIGRTKISQLAGQVQQEDYQLKVTVFKTYVLPNEPDHGINKSLPYKLFGGHYPEGYANAFVKYKAIHHYQKEAKEIEIALSLIRLSVKAKKRLTLRVNHPTLPTVWVMNEGDFEVVVPYFQHEKIDQVCVCEPWPLQTIQPGLAELGGVYDVEAVAAQEKRMEEEKEQNMQKAAAVAAANASADPAMPVMDEPKLTCKVCTFDNELTADMCEMCQNSLY